MKTKIGIWCSVLGILLVSGCARSQNNDHTLNLHLDADPTTLDPALMTDVRSGRLSALLYDTLIQYNEKLQVIPELAEKWTVNKEGTEYTFELRDGILFSDGTPLTAEDLRFSLERLADPKTASPRSWIISHVEGYEEYRSHHSHHISGLKVLTPRQLSITLKEPFAPFLALLTMPNASVLSKAAWLEKGQIMGTGPFSLEYWKHDSEILLRANTHYFMGSPKTQKIRFRMIKETLFVSSEFRRGRLDWIEVPSTELAFYLRDPIWQDQLIPMPNLSLYYLGFNCSKSPLHLPQVRQAIAQAIDRNQLIRTLRNHRATPIQGPIPPGVLGYEAHLRGEPYHEVAAKTALAQFPRELILLQSNNEETLELSEAIQSQLARVGLTVKIVELEWSAFKEALSRGEFDLFLLSWWADYPDGENFLYPLFHSSNLGSGGNYTRFQDPRIDQLILQSRKTTSDVKRKRLYQEIQREILNQAPMVFLYSSRSIIAKQPWIEGFHPHPLYHGNKLTRVTKRSSHT